MQFGCATAYQSQVVLGRAGAEKITRPGRALISFGGKIIEVQTFWVDKERVLGLRRGPACLCDAVTSVRQVRAAAGAKQTNTRTIEATLAAMDFIGCPFLVIGHLAWKAPGVIIRRVRADYSSMGTTGFLAPNGIHALRRSL